MLGGESVESYALLKDRFTPLPVGRAVKISTQRVGFRAGLKLENTVLEIQRLDSAATGSHRGGARRYRISVLAGGKTATKQLLTVDAAGWPVSLETSGKYTVTFRRVSP